MNTCCTRPSCTLNVVYIVYFALDKTEPCCKLGSARVYDTKSEPIQRSYREPFSAPLENSKFESRSPVGRVFFGFLNGCYTHDVGVCLLRVRISSHLKLG